MWLFCSSVVRIGHFSFPFSCQKVAWRKSFASNEISSVYPRAILKMGSINRYSRVHRTDPAFDSSRSNRNFRFEFSVNPRATTYISSSKKTISMIGMCVRSVICTKNHGHICNRTIVRSSGRLRHLDFFSHYLAGINPRTIDHTHDFKTTSDLSFWLRPTGISQSVRPRGIPRFIRYAQKLFNLCIEKIAIGAMGRNRREEILVFSRKAVVPRGNRRDEINRRLRSRGDTAFTVTMAKKERRGI